ncbi:DNA-directed RNA polymerases I and III subunit rpac1-like isoform X1 [Ananas comosus]|uniref:DNA-directed RNA polymerases I and III subunit RPAC1 n=3 Tax=Ananas comosus TaxID=4615 RepID=A0A6P5G4H9_ANACO|nr:DNA-directed RNA polymerases I and III subunit rpac1-like isoform X1 [Ananas comosus]
MPKVSALDMEDVPKGKLPEHLELQRTRVVCKGDAPIHTEGIQYSGAYASMGVDNSLRMDNFCKNFKIEIKRLTEDEMEFDMIGIDASIANAFRRILIAEVPTMAIEKVFMVDNTSVIADEVLAHRLGLIPLDADPRQFEYLSENDVPNERNTIVYELKLSCKKGSPRLTVKSDQLKWLPDGSQLHKETPSQSAEPKTYTSFSGNQLEVSKKPLGVTYKDIILAKLGAGQAIELEAHAVKGIGKDHAKWSPVATAWYRMLPEVVFLKEVTGADAEELVKKCPVNVFDIEDLGNGKKRAVAARPRACTLCRECIRGVTEEAVELRRVKDHFIFTIESTGALPPEVLFTEAVKILEEKCNRLITELS